MSREVVVVETAVANTASVLAGLSRVGARPTMTADPKVVAEARALVLPGVGAFQAAMDRIVEKDLVPALRNRIQAGRPTLAVCLGLQLLCETSEEGPGIQGLGIIPARIRRFPDSVRVPQLGWNSVTPSPGCALLKPGFAYFANSFRLVDAPDSWSVAWSDYAGPFVAAMERGPVLACQFHPELSGQWGIELLERWLIRAEQE